ncbi:MAG: hypothetical protein COA70_08065 [Planctomycetota bacterium]|nr:MAG: hypothetical protein COA70_08065 [Planctomycetota bacterium]
MKVRLFTLAAAAAITLTSQGVAQQNDSLERALADLNSGLTAPAGNGGVAIAGDFRARNRWYDSDAADATNNRDVDTRARMTFTFNVTESSTAFVGFNGRESWGDGGFGTTPGNFDDPVDAFQLTRSWVSVDSLFGEGGTSKIGRDYYTSGSGRILGTDEWDNRPATQSGIWFTHPAGGVNFRFAMMNGVERGFGSTAPSPTSLLDEGDDMVYVVGLDWVCDYVEQLGPMHVAPYWIRNEDTGAEFQSWLGILFSGELMGFGYEAEYAAYDMGSVDGDAWYVATSIDLDALESIPGVDNGGLDIALSSSDDMFMTTGTTRYHNAAGFSDRLGAGGLWTPDTDTWQVGLSFSPAEGWSGRVAVANVETGSTEWDEIDVSVGTTLGGNVMAWFGYAMVDAKSGAFEDEDTFWAVLDLGFGE